MWGIRVIVPPKRRPQVLVELHQGHLGVVKMSALARNYTSGAQESTRQLKKPQRPATS